eukprot:tig00000451_g975.t1
MKPAARGAKAGPPGPSRPVSVRAADDAPLRKPAPRGQGRGALQDRSALEARLRAIRVELSDVRRRLEKQRQLLREAGDNPAERRPPEPDDDEWAALGADVLQDVIRFRDAELRSLEQQVPAAEQRRKEAQERAARTAEGKAAREEMRARAEEALRRTAALNEQKNRLLGDRDALADLPRSEVEAIRLQQLATAGAIARVLASRGGPPQDLVAAQRILQRSSVSCPELDLALKRCGAVPEQTPRRVPAPYLPASGPRPAPAPYNPFGARPPAPLATPPQPAPYAPAPPPAPRASTPSAPVAPPYPVVSPSSSFSLPPPPAPAPAPAPAAAPAPQNSAPLYPPAHPPIYRTPSARGRVSSSDFDPEPGGPPLRPVRIAAELVDLFEEIARPNTEANRETCAVLAGRPVGEGYQVTALILPPQSGTPDSCETEEDEMGSIAVTLEHQLTVLGCIHTHPSQECFLSSIDQHNLLGYQLQLPEAISIVVAPLYPQEKLGVFRLTARGVAYLRRCDYGGFHEHDGGRPGPLEHRAIYRRAAGVELLAGPADPSLLQVYDLRRR